MHKYPIQPRLNDNEWESRCLAHMLRLCPSIEIPAAGMLISTAGAVGTLRAMVPERVAEDLVVVPPPPAHV